MQFVTNLVGNNRTLSGPSIGTNDNSIGKNTTGKGRASFHCLWQFQSFFSQKFIPESILETIVKNRSNNFANSQMTQRKLYTIGFGG